MDDASEPVSRTAVSSSASATAAAATAALGEGPAYRPPRREAGDSPLVVVVVVVVAVDRGLGIIPAAHVEARYDLVGGVGATLTRAIRPPLGVTHAPVYPEAEFAEERTLIGDDDEGEGVTPTVIVACRR